MGLGNGGKYCTRLPSVRAVMSRAITGGRELVGQTLSLNQSSHLHILI